jgi:hypothetical protein
MTYQINYLAARTKTLGMFHIGITVIHNSLWDDSIFSHQTLHQIFLAYRMTDLIVRKVPLFITRETESRSRCITPFKNQGIAFYTHTETFPKNVHHFSPLN